MNSIKFRMPKFNPLGAFVNGFVLCIVLAAANLHALGTGIPLESSNNTSTTALGSNETYTGTEDRNSYPDVMTSVKTDADGTLYYEPDNQTVNFVEVDLYGLQSTGNTGFYEPYNPYLVLNGPGILKLNGTASANDLDVIAKFSGVLVDNQ